MDELLDIFRNRDFATIDQDFLSDLGPTLLEIVKNPGSNLPAAILIFAIAAILLIMIGIAIIYFVLGEPDEEEYVEVSTAAAASAPVRKRVVVKDPLRHYTRFLFVFGAIVGLYLAAGVSTQQSSVCLSCHSGSTHTKPSEVDPHADVSCTRCHDAGGVVASVTTAVPNRIVHVVKAVTQPTGKVGYGKIADTSCRSCHKASIVKTVEIENRALRISHAEPLAAGADCLDCHRLDGDEKLTQATVGMGPCLSCHDGKKASAECSACHTGDVSKAVLANNTRSENNARQLVKNPSCYSCHDPRPCDSCHGVRLPHPDNFVFKGHQRAAAIDLWKNEGRTCYSCHTDTRRSCYSAQCHEIEMPMHSKGNPSWKVTHSFGAGSPDGDCEQCHNRLRSFDSTCEMCH